MARVVSPIGISGPLVLADFYREEFLRHRECLAQQREYYSERAITRVLNQLEHLCAKEDADKVMTTLLRKFDVVTGLSGWSDPKNYH